MDAGGGKNTSGRRRRLSTRRLRRTTAVTRRHDPDPERSRILVPILDQADEELLARAQQAGLDVCALYLAETRPMRDVDGSALFAARISDREIVESARVLAARVILIAHLPPNLQARLAEPARAAGLTTVGYDHPLAKKLLA